MKLRWLMVAALTLSAAQGQVVWPTESWPVSTPEEQGMDSGLLAQADAFISANCPTRRSFLVIRNGRLVYERYYGGWQPDRTYHIASISKGFLAALAGLALQDGSLSGLDRKVLDYFPEYASASLDPRKQDITLLQLLTMSAGLTWDETGPIFNDWVNSPNWIQFILDLPVASAPGTTFNYDTGLAHLFSGVLTKATGGSTEQYARAKLFGRLGITSLTWSTDPQGISVGGFRLYLSARDTAKLGYLFLRDGKWEDQQLLPLGWAQQCTKLQITNLYYSPALLGDYGYFWWIRRMGGLDVKAAMGFGGQYVFVVPDLDLIVVTTATSDNDTTQYHTQAAQLMTSFVLPAVQLGVPAVAENGVVNAASYASPVTPDSFISVFGQNLGGTARDWGSVITDGRTLPIEVATVSARIDGRDCYVSYASPNQVNLVLPPDLAAGTRTLEITNWKGSTSVDVQVAAVAPGLFTVVRGGKLYPAGYLESDGAALGDRAAGPGEYIALYGTGLGPTAAPHPVGEILTEAYALADPSSVRVTIGGTQAPVLAVMMTYAGVYQIDVQVPAGLPGGELPLTLEAGGTAAQLGVVLPVRGQP